MEHLVDYVWMAKKDGPPEKVSTAGDAISQKMWQNYRQVDPPPSPAPVVPPAPAKEAK